jgi:two-component system, OmpR family, heavy metal sensor histidine kinase CusS
VRGLSVRWRLTLWYGATLSAILIGFSGAVYLRMRDHLLNLTDATLYEELVELEVEIGRARGLSSRSLDELEIRFSSPEGYVFQVGTVGGKTLFRSIGVRAGELPAPDARLTEASSPIYQSVNLYKLGPSRLASCVIPSPPRPLLIQAAATLAPNIRALQELMVIALTIGPLALACALGGGYWLARKALAPVDRMAVEAAEITSARLDRRLVEPVTEDEFSCLARTFNAMIARLQRSFEEIRRFTADAAHELRTPLAAMRTEAEVALCSPRSPERDGRVLEDLLEEIERLTRLVSHLLFLSREDTGIGARDFQPVHLDDVVRDVGEHMQVAAREKGVKLVVDLPELCQVSGDAHRLRQLFFNLLDNAIKYTPPDGKVTIEGKPSNGEAHVIVADTGIGIPADHLPYVFDRFYRVDPSRSPETDGSGLGLAICRSIAEAHGGRIEIDSTLGSGTRVTLSLPILREYVDDLETPR